MLRLRATFANRTVTAPLRAELSIGSATDNDVVIAARGVSRHHARVERCEGRLAIIDAGSKNGLRVGHTRHEQIVLQKETVFSIGEAVVRVEEISTSDAELGIELPRGASSSSAHAADTRTIDDPRSNQGMSGALRWARTAEGGIADRDMGTLMESARNVIGAESLVAFSKKGADDITITALAGRMPDAEDVQWLAHGGGPWVIARTDDTFLAARLSDRRVADSMSALEFLEYVRERLFSAADGTSWRSAVPSGLIILPEFIAGPSQATRKLLGEVEQLARGHVDILITGETGVGKELVGRMIHASGATAGGAFVAVNVTTMTADIADAELFGVAHRAATGVDARPGYFATAAGGTIFLDEIGDMPLSTQPKLLRALQEREIRPVGGGAPRKIQLRVISSTNHNLQQAVAAGTLRSDLFFRLGVQIRVPPLRERREDIPAIVLAMIRSAARAEQKRVTGISRKALATLMDYEWPGNIRELKNTITRSVLVCTSGGAIERAHLAIDDTPPPSTELEGMKRDTIERALRRARGNKAAAARFLGVSRQGLYLMLKRYGLS